ncbi:MAG: UDP-3-O-acyl-N-acetylglucosamine deacetylase [Deltaproteobacteria bacterium]|nr:UDP-3-O-acyl-N-acetylglucosamine deacetylase [Deltaproteobacteria bacterium]
MLRQRTIREKASCIGVGLHSGRKIKLEILPAPEGNGITFVRTDMRLHAELKACIEHVADTTLATTLSAGVNGSRATVGTVEHLLAALSGLGIDNARVLVDGPEIPIMDGSAAPYVEMLQAAGLEAQRKLKRFLVIKKEVKVRDGDKLARIAPGSGFKIRCTVDFDHPLIPPLPYLFQFSERSFLRDLVRARTFGFLKDVEALRERGLARGGSLENAVVIDEYRVLNPEGLRYSDEFVRHKVLDALGDLSLLGMTVIGHVELVRAGHALNTHLVRKVLKDPKAFEIVEPAAEELEQAMQGADSRFPQFESIGSVV